MTEKIPQIYQPLTAGFDENLPAPEFEGQKLIVGGILYFESNKEKNWVCKLPPLFRKELTVIGISPAQEALNVINIASEKTKEILFYLQKESDKDKKVVKLSDYRF